MTDCFTPVRGRRARLTKLDNCGRPVYGDCSQVVTKGLIEVGLSAQTSDNETEGQTNAAGETCIPSESNTELTHYELTISFCEVDPDFVLGMYPHWDPHVNDQGERVGWHQRGGLPTRGFALEIWTDIQSQSSDPCAGGGASQGQWGYMLLPWVMGQAPGDLTISNAPVTFEFQGNTKLGSGWGRGPYLVEIVDGRPQRLRAPGVKSDTHLVIFKTGVRPPEPQCGCQPVDRPTPDPATIMIEGVSGEDPRRTVRLRADNHGFGPVTVDWGDGSDTTTARDGQWVTHQYPAPSQGGDDYTITVRDQQTPVVQATRDITIPLPPDNPELDVAAVSGNNMAVNLSWDNHGNGTVSIDWGDGSDVLTEQLDSGERTHEYQYPGLYTITVWDEQQTTHRSRTAVSMPTQPPPEITATKLESDPDGRTFDLDITAGTGTGPTAITWGDGTQQDGPEQGTVQHVYDADGEYTITVTSKSDPLSKSSTTVTAGAA